LISNSQLSARTYFFNAENPETCPKTALARHSVGFPSPSAIPVVDSKSEPFRATAVKLSGSNKKDTPPCRRRVASRRVFVFSSCRLRAAPPGCFEFTLNVNLLRMLFWTADRPQAAKRKERERPFDVQSPWKRVQNKL